MHIGIIGWMEAFLRDPSGRLTPTNWDGREKEDGYCHLANRLSHGCTQGKVGIIEEPLPELDVSRD